jgi:glutamate transport system ATP-binding protein
MHPKVMLFDEPTSALDPEMVNEVLDVMVELGSGGDDDDRASPTRWASRVKAANRVVFMADGEILEEGTPEEFFEHPTSETGPGLPGARS